MQIFHSQHYTTLITYQHRYYHYDGLGLTVPNTISQLHAHLRQWYNTVIKPPVLEQQVPTVCTPSTPQQTNGWSCATHMLLTSLTAIYQGQVPLILYGQRHVDQLHRAHLRYVLTGQILPRIKNLITYIADPQNNEDPVPYCKPYSAGGNELTKQKLERKSSKKGKLNKSHTPNPLTTTPHTSI
jgi:hypothetical protein